MKKYILVSAIAIQILSAQIPSGIEESRKAVTSHCVVSYGAVIRFDTTQKNIYLVFTAHEFAEGKETVIAALRKQNVKASFFFTGDFYRNPFFAKTIAELKKEGHYLGAHSDTHLLYAPWEKRDSLLVTKEQFMDDLKRNYAAMEKFGIHKTDAPFFLPPYEWYNQQIAEWTAELGLTLINFSPGTSSNADYTTPDMKNYLSSDTIETRILNYEKKNGMNGFILLTHIGTDALRTDKLYARLGRLIAELQRRGYHFQRL
jgi:peptidoglycan/xylan/chitin deacetylase (PgdA/CDA1 family)